MLLLLAELTTAVRFCRSTAWANWAPWSGSSLCCSSHWPSSKVCSCFRLYAWLPSLAPCCSAHLLPSWRCLLGCAPSYLSHLCQPISDVVARRALQWDGSFWSLGLALLSGSAGPFQLWGHEATTRTTNQTPKQWSKSANGPNPHKFVCFIPDFVYRVLGVVDWVMLGGRVPGSRAAMKVRSFKPASILFISVHLFCSYCGRKTESEIPVA